MLKYNSYAEYAFTGRQHCRQEIQDSERTGSDLEFKNPVILFLSDPDERKKEMRYVFNF